LSGKIPLANRIGNALEVLLVALFGSLLVPIALSIAGLSPERILHSVGYLVILLVSEASVTLLLIMGLLKLRGQSLRELGWNLGSPRRESLTGFLFIPALFMTVFLVSITFQKLLPDFATHDNPLLGLIKSPTDLLLMIISSIYVGGFKEEIQRAFVLNRFQENLGGAIPGLVIWSTFFGWGHLVQGVDNAVGAGLLGLLFGLLYLWRRSLTGPIVAHAAYDVLTVTIFWNFFRA
jgi:membrane protease YdiL (CAAX protease family)